MAAGLALSSNASAQISAPQRDFLDSASMLLPPALLAARVNVSHVALENTATKKTDQNDVVLHYTAIDFSGNTVLSTSQLKRLAEPYLNRDLTLVDLKQLANNVTTLYIDEGYFLSKASISLNQPRQGLLTISMVEGSVADIVFTGDDIAYLPALFAPLKQDKPTTRATLDLAMAKARMINGVKIKTISQKRIPGNKEAVLLEVDAQFSKFGVDVYLTNKGSREGEDVKLSVSGRVNSLLRMGDNFRIGFLTKPEALDDLNYASAQYEVPLGWKNAHGFISYTHSETEPRSVLVGRDLFGSLNGGKAGITIPLIFAPMKRLSFTAQIEASDNREFENGLNLYTDRLRLVRGRLDFIKRDKDRSQTNLSFEYSQGFNIFGASDGLSMRVSRPGADAFFKKIFTELTHQKFLSGKISTKISFAGQYADTPLLYSEEFGVGGGSYGRGYDYGEVLGDSGAATFIELIYHGSGAGLLERWEAYGFVDSGATWNHGTSLSADGTWLSSAGLGARLYIGDIASLAYEAAMPLSDAPYTLDDEDIRHRFDIAIRY